ncbi:MAG: DUF6310 domain-containing protein [Cystobacter sp.]
MGGGASSRRFHDPGPCWRRGAIGPSTMTGLSFTISREEARWPPLGPLPWVLGSASWRPRVRPSPETHPEPVPLESSPKQKPRPQPSPYHRGGHQLHNQCADRVPNNSFPGGDVFVNGMDFDALQLTTRTLWEVKTDSFDTYPLELREVVLVDQLPELQHERALALACGFDFKVGVRSAAHRDALLNQDITLDIVIMDWC